jgi:hypothetical protein
MFTVYPHLTKPACEERADEDETEGLLPTKPFDAGGRAGAGTSREHCPRFSLSSGFILRGIK